MSGISLTASMRSNLLSLQNIASQQDIVQNRLATGLKVSSAIDNPSSYYTASSLNNRAADLTALLDAMSQGIQTIKAASEAIDSGTKFLEQAKAVAFSALETAQPVIARVSSEAELLTAIDSGQRGRIILENDIDMSGSTIRLRNGQSLTSADKNLIVSVKADQILGGTDSTFSNLRIEANLSFNNQKNISLSNLNIKGFISAVNSEITVSGKLNILNSTMNTSFYIQDNSQINFASDAVINSNSSNRFMNIGSSRCTIEKNAVINALVTGRGGEVLHLYDNAVVDIRGSINGLSQAAGFAWLGRGDDNRLNFYETAKIYADIPDGASLVTFYEGKGVTDIKAQAQVGFNQGTQTKFFETAQDFSQYNKNLTLQHFINDTASFAASQHAWIFDFTNFTADTTNLIDNRSTFASSKNEAEIKFSINMIIPQYNNLLKDASYKGINLLAGQSLKINFNEDRSSKIDIAGVKADSESLGLKTKEWKTAEDIEKSISELENAINTLRSFASAFGNYYSIVTTRQDFTENLINVLEEGADKLTLADMNQESANMLALQTSQQLAVNSLSLASQASQSILRLF